MWQRNVLLELLHKLNIKGKRGRTEDIHRKYKKKKEIRKKSMLCLFILEMCKTYLERSVCQ